MPAYAAQAPSQSHDSPQLGEEGPAQAPDAGVMGAQNTLGNAALASLLPGIQAPVQQGMDFAGELFEREGVGALTDPVGAADRLRASEELSDRFDVVGDDFVGPRMQNQLSQEEYDEVVRMYSDVRLGRGDLTLDSSEMGEAQSQAFQDAAMGDIARLLQTESGREMIRQMSNNVMVDDEGNERKFLGDHEVTGSWLENFGQSRHRHTTLSALHQDTNGDWDRSNDGNAPIDLTNGFSDPELGNGVGVSQRNADGTRGSGSDVTIRANPGVMLDFNGDGNPDTTTTSDIILMHELAHARHQTQGTLASGQIQADGTIPAGHPDIGTQNWEHQAAGLGHWADESLTENGYRRDRQSLGEQIPLRPSYSTLP
ncbi:MAG: hypothetical protein H6741_11650 [Alphaproteobacteria bacterium]|nr:hypothetical protein [Alphaproteobacteria bacterium]